MMDTSVWVKEQWEQAKLGDTRRNNRAIKLAKDLLSKPSASLPEQCPSWAALKAAYRFFNEEDVTFEALQKPHRSQVIQQAGKPGVTLFIQDGSELDYSAHDVDLGPIGNHKGHGFCLHTTLAVYLAQDYRDIVGVAHQVLWERETRSKKL